MSATDWTTHDLGPAKGTRDAVVAVVSDRLGVPPEEVHVFDSLGTALVMVAE